MARRAARPAAPEDNLAASTFGSSTGLKPHRTIRSASGAAALTPTERTFLETKCHFLPRDYVDYLASFRFRPAEQLKLTFTPITVPATFDGAQSGEEFVGSPGGARAHTNAN